MANGLRPWIRPRYITSIEEFVYIEGPGKSRAPDLWVQRSSVRTRSKRLARIQSATPVVVDVEEWEIHQPYVEILDRYEKFKVVTVLELVSPSNKAVGSGREAYVAKQVQLLASESHLIEIDLHRTGRHVMAVPEAYALAHGPYDYLISVNRKPSRTRFELYPARLREPLPRIRVPLSAADEDAVLDLQEVMERTYEEADYQLRVRYEEPCIPALRHADQTWADERWEAYLAKHPELAPAPRSRAKEKSTNGRRGKTR